MGKTTLAVHWAHRIRHRFPDGQLYANLRGFDPSAPALGAHEVLPRFLEALGVTPQRIPAGLDAQVALYRSLLAGTRTIVVLDNVRDVRQVRPLLPGAPGCLVVITSRQRMTSLIAVEGARSIELDLLSIREATELLAARLGPGRTAAEPDAVRDIVHRCARLPLALVVVAARAGNDSLQVLAKQLTTVHDTLDVLRAGDPHTDMRAVMSWSYRSLEAPTARLFRLLGLIPGPDISVAAAAGLMRVEPDQVRPMLAELSARHLLSEPSPGRFTFHDLLRGYAGEQAQAEDPEADRAAAIRRLLDHYVRTAHAAGQLLNPLRDPIPPPPPAEASTPEVLSDSTQATTWFTTEHAVLLAAVRLATGSGLDEHAWHLAWALTTYFDVQGHWHDWTATQEVAVEAAKRMGDPFRQAVAHRILSRAYRRSGRRTDALASLTDALDRYRELGDRIGQGHTHIDLALTLELQNDYDAALEHATRALDLYRAAGNVTGEATALNTIGWDRLHLGQPGQALRDCRSALGLHQRLGDRREEAATWDSIGSAQHMLGRHTEARDSFRQAVDLFAAIGDSYYEATVRTHVGDSFAATGEAGAAREAWRQALSTLEDLGHADAAEVSAKLRGLADHPS